jgi:hypothetical protein
MTTTQDILDVCTVKVIREDNLGWKRVIDLTDRNGFAHRALLIWDSYDGYEFMPLISAQPLSDEMIRLIESDEFEVKLDELTVDWQTE